MDIRCSQLLVMLNRLLICHFLSFIHHQLGLLPSIHPHRIFDINFMSHMIKIAGLVNQIALNSLFKLLGFHLASIWPILYMTILSLTYFFFLRTLWHCSTHNLEVPNKTRSFSQMCFPQISTHWPKIRQTTCWCLIPTNMMSPNDFHHFH